MSVSTPKDLLQQLHDMLRRQAGRAGKSVDEFLAWKEFVTIYEPVVRKFVNRHARSLPKQDRPDLARTIWADLFRSLQQFEYDPAKSFRGWLETLVKRRAIDEIRLRRGRSKEGPKPKISDASGLGNAIDPNAIDPADALEQSWKLAKVHAAIEDLRHEFSDRDYRIFRRVVIDEVPRKVVAEEFDVTVAVVTKQVERFRNRLAKLLDERFSRDGSSSEPL